MPLWLEPIDFWPHSVHSPPMHNRNNHTRYRSHRRSCPKQIVPRVSKLRSRVNSSDYQYLLWSLEIFDRSEISGETSSKKSIIEKDMEKCYWESLYNWYLILKVLNFSIKHAGWINSRTTFLLILLHFARQYYWIIAKKFYWQYPITG